MLRSRILAVLQSNHKITALTSRGDTFNEYTSTLKDISGAIWSQKFINKMKDYGKFEMQSYLPHHLVADYIEKDGHVDLPQGIAVWLLVRLRRRQLFLVVLRPHCIITFLIRYDVRIIFNLSNLQCGNFLLVFYIKKSDLANKYQNWIIKVILVENPTWTNIWEHFQQRWRVQVYWVSISEDSMIIHRSFVPSRFILLEMFVPQILLNSHKCWTSVKSHDVPNNKAIQRISSTYLVQLSSSYYLAGYSWIVV